MSKVLFEKIKTVASKNGRGIVALDTEGRVWYWNISDMTPHSEWRLLKAPERPEGKS